MDGMTINHIVSIDHGSYEKMVVVRIIPYTILIIEVDGITLKKTYIRYGILYLLLPTDAVCCPDINIENVVLSNIW